MRPFKASAIFSMVVVLGCSACTAGDKTSKVKSMQETPEKDVLVAGLEDADETAVSSDVTFYVRNNGNTAVDLLIWSTPLESELSADVFTVTLNGVPVTYQGRLVKRSEPIDKDFLNIPAQERAEAVVDLAVYYEMSAPGEYQVSFTPTIIDGQAHLNQQTPVLLDASALTVRVDPR